MPPMDGAKVEAITNYIEGNIKNYHITALGDNGMVSLYVSELDWPDALASFFEQVSREGCVQIAMRLVTPLEAKPKLEEVV